MEADKPTQKKQGLKWRCKEHPKFPCDFICLDGDAKDRVMCFDCVQKQQIPFQNLVSMSCVLASNEQDILEAYPPLQNQRLLDKLREANQQQEVEQIEAYFKKLREDFEKELNAAQQRAKELLIRQELVRQGLFEGFKRIAEVDKLKKLIVSEKQSAEQDLDRFIKDKWSKAEENSQLLENLIFQYEDEQYFQSEEPIKIADEITQITKFINFFQQPIDLSQISLIKSNYGTSQKMEITKVDNLIYQVKKIMNNGYYDQVFLDPIIDPSLKYILQIELEQKPGTDNNNFFFGLVKDEGKDETYAYGQNMSYYDLSNSFGVTNYIKGNPMQSGTNVTGKHSFEVRIDVSQQFLRVASLPDYSSIAELDDPNKIDPKVAYRFFLSIYYQGDMIRITNIKTVRQFNQKM